MNTVIENQQDLAKWVCSQKGRLDLAVAFWGDGAIAQLGLKNGRKARILLELKSGSTNPKVVQELLGMKSVQVKQRDLLHAKVYLGQDEMVIGSANASANGLGAEGKEATHWSELSVRIACPDAIAQAANWFDRSGQQDAPLRLVTLTPPRRHGSHVAARAQQNPQAASSMSLKAIQKSCVTARSTSACSCANPQRGKRRQGRHWQRSLGLSHIASTTGRRSGHQQC